MKVWTYVCEDCNAGWTVESAFDPMFRSDLCARCRWCGKAGKLRGVYTQVPLPFPV
jgi:hypothetical protein